MAYSGAKKGQVVYYAKDPATTRQPVTLVGYYRDNKNLTHPNRAVIDFGDGIAIHVAIKNLYRKAE